MEIRLCMVHTRVQIQSPNVTGNVLKLHHGYFRMRMSRRRYNEITKLLMVSLERKDTYNEATYAWLPLVDSYGVICEIEDVCLEFNGIFFCELRLALVFVQF